MQRITVVEADDDVPFARELFENDDEAQMYWIGLLGEGSVLPCLPCRAVMVVREELFKGTWVETCRKLVDLQRS